MSLVEDEAEKIGGPTKMGIFTCRRFISFEIIPKSDLLQHSGDDSAGLVIMCWEVAAAIDYSDSFLVGSRASLKYMILQ